MAIHHMTYLDLTPEQRTTHAATARQRLRGMMINPFLTPDQAEYLQNQLALIDAWERGEIAVTPPAA